MISQPRSIWIHGSMAWPLPQRCGWRHWRKPREWVMEFLVLWSLCQMIPHEWLFDMWRKKYLLDELMENMSQTHVTVNDHTCYLKLFEFMVNIIRVPLYFTCERCLPSGVSPIKPFCYWRKNGTFRSYFLYRVESICWGTYINGFATSWHLVLETSQEVACE